MKNKVAFLLILILSTFTFMTHESFKVNIELIFFFSEKDGPIIWNKIVIIK